MKKRVGIVLILAVIVGCGWFLAVKGKSAVGQYARYLPSDVIGAVNLTHLSAVSDNIASSSLGRFLAKDTMHTIIRELGGGNETIAEYDRLYDSVVEVAADPAFRTVFGDDVTLALLSPDKIDQTRDPAETLRQSLVVVARTAAAGAIDMLSKIISHAKVSRETIDGVAFVKIVMDDNQAVYGYTEGRLLFLAYDPAVIRACISGDKDVERLAQAPLYQQAVSFWQPYPAKDVYSRVYLNVDQLTRLTQRLPDAEIKESGELLAGITSLFSIGYLTPQGMENRGYSSYRYDQLHPMIKSTVDAAGVNRTVHFFKDSTLLYNWTSSLQPEVLIGTLASDRNTYQEMDADVRQILGVSLDELGKAFGPQYGGMLDEIVHTPLFPWPKAVLFVEVRDRKIAETVLNGIRRLITGSGMVAEQQDQVQGHTVYSWPILPAESAQLAIALTDDMLYLATSKATLQNLLAADTASNQLTATVKETMGTGVVDRLMTANSSSLIVQPHQMAVQAGAALDWLGGILTATKNISMGRLNREVVQLLQSVDQVVATSHLTEERAEWTMTVKKAAE